jgi:DNA sulfur modification protein DndD
MWIERLELANFKAYQDQTFTFLKPQNGRNLVLIGGLNGHGKTTLLEAL